MILRCCKNLLFAVLVLCCASAAASGQVSSADLRVVVVDPAAAVISGGAVEMRRDGILIGFARTVQEQAAAFLQLQPGRYQLKVQADGFASQILEIQLKPGANVVRVKLELSRLSEVVNVGRDDEERRTERDGAFNTVLTAEQLSDLPDDPDALEEILKRMAGPDATIRVDGFTGSRLPPKSQIASIKIVHSLYDVEFHEAGSELIDVTTKAGGGRWSGLLGFRFSDEALNARNAFAAGRRPTQLRNLDFTAGGPVWRNRATLFVAGFATNSFDNREIFAATPSGVLRGQVRVPTHSFYGLAKLSFNISKVHFLNAGYERDTTGATDLAADVSDLPIRGFAANSTLNRLRVSETGTFGTKIFNELRVQAAWQNNDTQPASDAPAVVVLGAFSSGGAENQDRTRTHSFSLTDIVTLPIASHTLKVGGFVEREVVTKDSAVNAGGTFIFESLDDFLSSHAATYSVQARPALVEVPQTRFGFFAQDDIRLRTNFSLNLGIRYERQTDGGKKNNLAPRAGFSWAPRNGLRTTVRGGVGIFWSWIGPDTLTEVAAHSDQSRFETIIINPGFPNPSVGGAVEVLPPSLWRTASDLQSPYLLQASLGIEQPLGKSLLLRANYVHQLGRHLLRSRDLNGPLAGLGRPEPKFGNLLQVESSASLQRDALNLTATGAPGKASYFLLEYTLEKATNDSDGAFSLPANSYDLRSEMGESSAARHSFFASVGYRPWKSLRVSINYSCHSPQAYNITTGRDDNGDSFFNDRPPGVRRNSGRGTWQGNMLARLSWTLVLRRLSSDANSVPGTIIVDQTEAASGSIELTPKWTVNFYVQGNNLLNQTNYLAFSGVQTSPFFGKPTAAAPARRVELGIRFSF